MAKNNKRLNNTLIFNALVNGLSWDLVMEMQDEIKRQDNVKLPTKKDILTDWIISKDYMLQLQGEQYKKGGHLFWDGNDLDNWDPDAYMQTEDYLNFMNGISGNNNNDSSQDNTSMGSGMFEGINSIAAPAVGGLANSFNYNDYWGNSSEVNKAAYGDSTADPIARFLGNISGTGLKRAKDEIENKRQGNILNLNYGDNASLMSQIEAYNRSKAGQLSQLGDLTVGGGITDFLNSTGLGALHGSTILPGWGTLGGAILGSASWIGNAIIEGANRKKLNALILDANNDLIRNDLRIAYTVNNNQLLNAFNQLQHMTKNGGKLKKSYKFAEGGLLNTYDYGLEEVNAGGSHEENPNEGVVVSYAPDGLPNKVEEGETIHNDYVYSKRLEANEKVLENNLLDRKYKGKSFADISKKLTEDRKERPNDPISVRTNEENLNRLQGALEELKFDNKTREVKRFLGSLNNDLLNALQQEMMGEYEAYAEQLAQQQEAEDLAYQEEQAALEGMFGKGGVLQYGGDLRDAARLIDNLGKEETLNDKLTKHAADVYFYTTHPKTAIDAAKRRYRKENELFKKTPYGNLVSFPIPSITNTYENIKDGIEDYKARKSVERLIKYESDRLQGKERRKYPSDYLWDFVNKVTGYPSLTSDKKSNNGTFNRGGHFKQGTYGSSYLEREPWYTEPTIVSTWNNPLNVENKIFELSNPINLEQYGIYERNAEGEIKKSKDGKPIIKKEYKKPEGNSPSSLAPLRFAEAFGSAGLYLSDILGLTNQPDYSNARMYQRAVDNIGGVNFTPIGDYVTHTPIDTEYLANQQMATAAARRNYGNVAGDYTLGLLNDYNTLNQIGATAIAAKQQDREQKIKDAEFNRTTNAKNSEMSLDTQKQNAALRALRALEYRYLADMMTKERDINEAARAANYQNFISNLAAIGREDFNYDQIKWMIDHGVFPVGAESYLTGLKIK